MQYVTKIVNYDIKGFTETQINSSGSACKILETLNFSILIIIATKNIFLSLAYGCRNVFISDKLDANVVSISSFKKHAFAGRVFTVLLVYRKQSLGMQKFSQLI